MKRALILLALAAVVVVAITVADERWRPESGFYVDFKVVVEQDTISAVINDEEILDKLGIQSGLD